MFIKPTSDYAHYVDVVAFVLEKSQEGEGRFLFAEFCTSFFISTQNAAMSCYSW